MQQEVLDFSINYSSKGFEKFQQNIRKISQEITNINKKINISIPNFKIDPTPFEKKANEVASAMMQYFPQSPAKKGALRGLENSGQQIINQLILGMNNQYYRLIRYVDFIVREIFQPFDSIQEKMKEAFSFDMDFQEFSAVKYFENILQTSGKEILNLKNSLNGLDLTELVFLRDLGIDINSSIKDIVSQIAKLNINKLKETLDVNGVSEFEKLKKIFPTDFLTSVFTIDKTLLDEAFNIVETKTEEIDKKQLNLANRIATITKIIDSNIITMQEKILALFSPAIDELLTNFILPFTKIFNQINFSENIDRIFNYVQEKILIFYNSTKESLSKLFSNFNFSSFFDRNEAEKSNNGENSSESNFLDNIVQAVEYIQESIIYYVKILEESLTKIISWVQDNFTYFVDRAQEIANIIYSQIEPVINSLINWVSSGKAWESMLSVLNSVQDNFTYFVDRTQKIANIIYSQIEPVINSLINWVSSGKAWEQITTILEAIGSVISTIIENLKNGTLTEYILQIGVNIISSLALMIVKGLTEAVKKISSYILDEMKKLTKTVINFIIDAISNELVQKIREAIITVLTFNFQFYGSILKIIYYNTLIYLRKIKDYLYQKAKEFYEYVSNKITSFFSWFKKEKEQLTIDGVKVDVGDINDIKEIVDMPQNLKVSSDEVQTVTEAVEDLKNSAKTPVELKVSSDEVQAVTEAVEDLKNSAKTPVELKVSSDEVQAVTEAVEDLKNSAKTPVELKISDKLNSFFDDLKKSINEFRNTDISINLKDNVSNTLEQIKEKFKITNKEIKTTRDEVKKLGEEFNRSGKAFFDFFSQYSEKINFNKQINELKELQKLAISNVKQLNEFGETESNIVSKKIIEIIKNSKLNRSDVFEIFNVSQFNYAPFLEQIDAYYSDEKRKAIEKITGNTKSNFMAFLENTKNEFQEVIKRFNDEFTNEERNAISTGIGKKIENFLLSDENKNKLKTELEEIKKAIQQFSEENKIKISIDIDKLTTQEKTKKIFDSVQSSVKNLESTFANLYEVTGQKSKEFFYLQKSLALAESIINTANAATKAYAQGGILGIVEAATIVAQGAAQSAVIASQTFARGGLVLGGSGTHDDIPAMLTGGEFVIQKKAVDFLGIGLLEQLNNMHHIQNGQNGNIKKSSQKQHRFGAGSDSTEEVSGQRNGQNITIANFINPNQFSKFLQTQDGKRSIVNVIAENKVKLKEILR